MSRVPAASKEPELRLENIEARLRTHDWVQDARLICLPADGGGIGHSGQVIVQMVPSAAGIRALRRQGKGYLVAELGRYLEPKRGAGSLRIDWRLTETLPEQGQDVAMTEVGVAGMPIISDLLLDWTARSLTCCLLVPYDLPLFGGHFTTKPIVPGVIQVGWAIELARMHGLVTGRFTGISNAKFRRLVQPGMSLAAQLEFGAKAGQVRFRYEFRGNAITTGRVQFESDHD